MNQSKRPLWQTILIVMNAWPILWGLRIVWQTHVGLWACILFWAIDLIPMPLIIREQRGRRQLIILTAFIGAVGNAVATIGNNGTMPVLGHISTQHSVWVPMTDASRFKWLCDIHGGASIGDLFIAAALTALFVNWIAEKLDIIARQTPLNGRRIAGVGIG